MHFKIKGIKFYTFVGFCPGHVTTAMIQIVPLNAGGLKKIGNLPDIQMYIAKHNLVQKVHTFLKQQLYCS